MNELIQRIVNAMIRQEGRPSDFTNPGNLRDCPWLPILTEHGKAWKPPLAEQPSKITRYYPDTLDAEGNVEYVVIFNNFWIARTRSEGVAGLAHLVALHIAQGNSLKDFIAGHPGIYSGFAPGSDHNKPDVYIANVKEWACISDETKPLWNYLGE